MLHLLCIAAHYGWGGVRFATVFWFVLAHPSSCKCQFVLPATEFWCPAGGFPSLFPVVLKDAGKGLFASYRVVVSPPRESQEEAAANRDFGRLFLSNGTPACTACRALFWGMLRCYLGSFHRGMRGWGVSWRPPPVWLGFPHMACVYACVFDSVYGARCRRVLAGVAGRCTAAQAAYPSGRAGCLASQFGKNGGDARC